MNEQYDKQQLFDLAIIGGGINGAGIAADAAGRGLRVVLCEQNDLASGTSSHSTKLIHGGLRYLEQYEFRLVREALQEREVLLRVAPHLIHPLLFVLPHHHLLRPAWLIRCGLFLYDHLGKRNILPTSEKINLHTHRAGIPLENQFKIGFVYADCQTDDSRLVIANALAAKQHGATVLTRHQCVAINKSNHHWTLTLINTQTTEPRSIQARVLINASGPWINQTLSLFPHPPKQSVTLVKGSHIVTPKLYSEHHAYLLQNPDKRVVFVTPFHQHYSLIGTTDIHYQDKPESATASLSEKEYLLHTVNNYFKTKITMSDIKWDFSGVRALVSDHASGPSELSRDYKLELTDDDNLVAVHVFGGKITTYRKLAEHCLALLTPYFPQIKPAWTASKPLPGGEFKEANFVKFTEKTREDFPWLPETLRERFCMNYGYDIYHLLSHCQHLNDLGEHFGGGLYRQEVDYLIQHEWATHADDILWRRTKLGLELSDVEIKKLEDYLKHQ